MGFGYREKVDKFISPSSPPITVDLLEIRNQCLNQATSPQNLFISYAWTQRREVGNNLVPVLRNSGYDYFIDITRIPQSENMGELEWQIEQGVGQCDTFLLVWSEHSRKSRWVRAELSAAVGMAKTIVPLLLDSAELPSSIQSAIKTGRIHCIDVGKSGGFREILNLLPNLRHSVDEMLAKNRQAEFENTDLEGVRFEWVKLNGGTLPDFSVGRYPVTQEQWKAIMGSNPAAHPGDDTRPVENVSWQDTQEFIDILNQKLCSTRKVRLLTDFEWEFACRAGSQGNWCFGNNEDLLPEYAWFVDNAGRYDAPGLAIRRDSGDEDADMMTFDAIRASRGPVLLETSPHEVNSVLSKKPNTWGIYHMHGNVSEWCDDDGYRGQANGTIRGGSYRSAPIALRCNRSESQNKGERNPSVGFRICRDGSFQGST